MDIQKCGFYVSYHYIMVNCLVTVVNAPIITEGPVSVKLV